MYICVYDYLKLNSMNIFHIKYKLKGIKIILYKCMSTIE